MDLRLTSSALALAAMLSPALADVTSEQVWQSWVEYYQSMGYQVSEGGRERAGDTLTLKDVAIKGGAPESQVSLALPQVTLTEDGAGKVRTVFADTVSGEANGVDADGKSFRLPFVLSMPGNTTVTSGAAEDMTHEFDYPTIDVALSSITRDGKESPLPIKLSLAQSTGTLHRVAGAPAKYDYTMNTANAQFSGDIPGEAGEQVKFDGKLADIGLSGEMTIPTGAPIDQDMNAALKAGLAMTGTLKAGALDGSLDFAGQTEEGQPQTGAGTYSSKGFEISYTMSRDGLGYQAGSDAAQFKMTASDMPFPISYGFESGGFDLQMPVMAGDAAQPYKLAYALEGLTLGDEIWNQFDPQAKLPRDPASLDMDVTGSMKLTRDLFDPANLTPEENTDPEAGQDADASADPAEPAPFELIDLALNQFALKLLGAEVTASGRLQAPEGGDMTTPVGEINARYEGVNGVIDKLAGIGLIPEDQVMSARMMLMMFAKPVKEGEDKLETRLEFKDGGSIFANGQQIK